MSPLVRTPTIDLFLDESRVAILQTCRFITCAVAVVAEHWDQMTAQERDFKFQARVSWLERIAQLLENSNGIAMLSHADLDKALLPTGELDSTDDIPQMSRTDNVWSHCFLFCIMNCLAALYRAGLRTFDLNIFHDPKKLKDAHWSSIRAAIHSKMIPIFQEAVQRNGFKIPPHVSEIREVPKPNRGEQPDRYQAGVAVADYLCEKFSILTSTPRTSTIRKRIFIRDHTKTVTKSLTENWPLSGENLNSF